MNIPNDMMVLGYFRYHPNHTVAYVALPVFVLITIYLAVRIIRQRAPSFMFKMIFFSTAECVGLALRIVCFKTNISLAKFLPMNILLLIPPNIVTLVFYNIVSNVLVLSNTKSNKLYLKPRFITIFFIICTVVASLMQAAGGICMLFNNLRDTGRKLSITGLSIQLCVFLTFGTTLVLIMRTKSIKYHVENVDRPEKKAINGVFMLLLLMIMRNVYRLVNIGITSVSTHEWPFFVFDVLIGAIVFLGLSTFNKYFPRRGDDRIDTLKEDIEAKEDKV